MSEEPSSPAKVRDLYQETAASYAEMMDREIELPIYSDTLARLAERIGLLRGVVLDTSCGSGHMLARYVERYDPGRKLVGVDLSPNMVAIARARLPATASVVVGDMRKLEDAESNSAAAVLSYFALHHLDPDSIKVALREWLRVLQPGGQLVIATWEGVGSIDYGTESDVVASRYGEVEMRDWISSVGFSIDRCVVEEVDGIEMDAIYIEATVI